MQAAVVASQSKTDQELKQLEAQVRDFGHASLAEVTTGARECVFERYELESRIFESQAFFGFSEYPSHKRWSCRKPK